MSRNSLVMIGMFVGSVIGGYVPMLFGADIFSYSSVLGNAAGGIVGVIITIKLTRDL